MGIDPANKMIRKASPGDRRGGRMEKYILRKAFDGWIPDEILWRQKEQFSDGVGYSWIDSIKARREGDLRLGDGKALPLPRQDALKQEA